MCMVFRWGVKMGLKSPGSVKRRYAAPTIMPCRSRGLKSTSMRRMSLRDKIRPKASAKCPNPSPSPCGLGFVEPGRWPGDRDPVSEVRKRKKMRFRSSENAEPGGRPEFGRRFDRKNCRSNDRISSEGARGLRCIRAGLGCRERTRPLRGRAGWGDRFPGCRHPGLSYATPSGSKPH